MDSRLVVRIVFAAISITAVLGTITGISTAFSGNEQQSARNSYENVKSTLNGFCSSDAESRTVIISPPPNGEIIIENDPAEISGTAILNAGGETQEFGPDELSSCDSIEEVTFYTEGSHNLTKSDEDPEVRIE